MVYLLEGVDEGEGEGFGCCYFVCMVGHLQAVVYMNVKVSNNSGRSVAHCCVHSYFWKVVDISVIFGCWFVGFGVEVYECSLARS